MIALWFTNVLFSSKPTDLRNNLKINIKAIVRLLVKAYPYLICLCLSPDCLADNNAAAIQKIAGYIVEYNREQIRLSESNGTYRGEEGILFIKPEEALKLGLKAYTDQDYLDAVALLEKGSDALEAAEKALSYRGREPEDAVIKKIISNILIYKENSLLANEKFANYRKRINKEQDERLNPEACNSFILTILNECMNETRNNLRDALACFYNRCHGIRHTRHFLAPENVRFVNSIFNRFASNGTPEDIGPFDMDKNSRNGNGSDYGDWKRVVTKELPEYVTYIESAVKKGSLIYPTDPLLFLALIKKESSFRPRAVSFVGAAGLTQLMPQTALDLGLKDVYSPEYYKNVNELSRTEREMRAKAREMLFGISKRDDIQTAKQAREYMHKSFNAGEKRKELLKKYKKELTDGRNDDRFDAQKVIEAGYIYFTRLMKSNNGDISLALASYNSGQHRIKEFAGRPPFSETIGFRNLILQYFNEYLEELTD
jgi:hypothetical protein